MQSTSDKVIAKLGEFSKRGNVYRSNSPLRTDSDSKSFALVVNGGEHGTYFDHVTKEGGSLYQLADQLGIERPRGSDTSSDSGEMIYKDLADYAKQKGVDTDVFLSAGWRDGQHRNRPAIIYPTATGDRVRFLDAQKPKYMPIGAGQADCFYGLDRAITIATDMNHNMIYCVNGEASVIVAQHYHIPAFCVTGGEKAFKDNLVDELCSKWNKAIGYIPDNDKAGQEAVQARAKQVRGVIINLSLGFDKADIADFCLLWADSSLDQLKSLTPSATVKTNLAISDFVGLDDTIAVMQSLLNGDDSALSYMPQSVPVAWDIMRPMVGDFIAGGKVWGIISSSGAGKTIALETMVYHNVMAGIPTLFVSPEWQPMELHFRLMLKNWIVNKPALTYQDFLAWIDAKARKVPGVLLPEQSHLVAQMTAMSNSRRYEALKFFNIKQARTTNINQVLQKCSDAMVAYKREHGVAIQMVIFDYVSVFDSEDKTSNEHENKLNAFKDFVMANDILGVTTSQVNKDAVRRVHEYGGHYVASDGYGIREDKFNYILTATPHLLTNSNAMARGLEVEHGKKPHHPYRDENGMTISTGNVLYHVAKNSVMSPRRQMWAHFDYKRLRVMSGVADGWQMNGNGGIDPI